MYDYSHLQIRMKMCKAWLLVVLACLLLPADGQPQEGVGETVIVDEAVDEQKPLEPASATSHFQEPVHDSQDTHLKEVSTERRRRTGGCICRSFSKSNQFRVLQV